MRKLGIDMTVVSSPDVVSCDLAGETALLNLASGTYYTLNPVATTVWCFIREPRRVSDIHALLLGRYEIEPEPCASDLLQFLAALSSNGLVEVHE